MHTDMHAWVCTDIHGYPYTVNVSIWCKHKDKEVHKVGSLVEKFTVFLGRWVGVLMRGVGSYDLNVTIFCKQERVGVKGELLFARKNRKWETTHTRRSAYDLICVSCTHPQAQWTKTQRCDPHAALSKYIVNYLAQSPVNRVVLGTGWAFANTLHHSNSTCVSLHLLRLDWQAASKYPRTRYSEAWTCGGCSAVRKLSIQNVCVWSCWVNHEPAGKHDGVMTSQSAICRKRRTPGRIPPMFLKRYTLENLWRLVVWLSRNLLMTRLVSK